MAKSKSIKKLNTKSRTINDTDQKILWSRAAGRCSMPECRLELTMDKTGGGTATLGEMCHIIDFALTGPRGKSPLTIKERNSYANLILLCAHHHKVIDTNTKKYPIERLYQIKANHELWVSESLSNKVLKPEEMVWTDIIDAIVISLQLDAWEWFISNAVRDIVHEDFLEARGNLNAKLLGAVWPKQNLQLTKSMQIVIKSFSNYITHFETKSIEKSSFLIADNSYKKYPYAKDYDLRKEQMEKWRNNNFRLLYNFVYRLNVFTDLVRKYINPIFFINNGYFLIHDDVGIYSGGEPKIIKTYSSAVKRLMKEFEDEEINIH